MGKIVRRLLQSEFMALGVALVACAPAWAEPGKPASPDSAEAVSTSEAQATDDKVVLNFVGADLQSVIKTIGLITGKNFLLDPRVNGTVNIVSANPVPKDQVYSIFLAALRVQGFAAVEGPGVVKIVPEADAKLNYSTTTEKRVGGSGDRIVTEVYMLKHENAAQLLPVLRPLISPNNVINAYPSNNTLVITDYAENLKRINKVIESIDVPQAGDIQVIPLRYASALDLSQLLTRLIPEASAPAAIPGQAPRLAIAVDPRSNSLVVRTDTSTALARIRGLVAGMDIPTAAGGNIHVVYLRNAEAPKVAEALHGILSGETRGAQAQAQPTAFAPTPGAPQQPAAAAPAAPTPVVQIPASQGGGSIQAYPATNSLIITAPDNVYNALRAVIEKLDARRAQVFVEALVVEVTTDKAAQFGIQWQDLSGISSDELRAIGGTNFNTPGTTNIINATKDITSVGPGLAVGLIKGTITLPNGTKVLNLGALATALESDRNANILSTPNLVTIDNEEAKIVVGQNVPFITGSQTSTVGGLQAPFQTIERHDVGLTLKVKPQIAEGGSVKLTIYQEVSSISDTTNAAGIITNKRSIESTVLVDDGHIVVLGGLIQDSTKLNRDKVPLLGDIPVLGQLFRSDSRDHQKTNLMVFMRPYVLRDIESPTQLTNERYEFIRHEQTSMQFPSHWAIPDMPGVILPQIQFPSPPASPNQPSTPQPEPGAEYGSINELPLQNQRSQPAAGQINPQGSSSGARAKPTPVNPLDPRYQGP